MRSSVRFWVRFAFVVGMLGMLTGCDNRGTDGSWRDVLEEDAGAEDAGADAGGDVGEGGEDAGGSWRDVGGELDAVDSEHEEEDVNGDVDVRGEDVGTGDTEEVVEDGGMDVEEDVAEEVDVREEPVDPLAAECENVYVMEILALVNASRAENGRGALACDPRLVRAARFHAEDMCAQNYFSHTSADGRTFSQRFREQGVSYRAGGENIAKGQRSSEEVHRAWMNSPGHRANILNERYDRLGVGHAQCASGRYWVQTFAG